MTNATVQPTFLTIGLDLGDRVTHACALDAARNVVDRKRIATRREALVRELGGTPASRVVLEAGPQSLWVSHLLRELGHEVVVVDPRSVRVIAQSDRKTDRLDAETLARLALGVPELLGRAHHRSLADQADLTMLRSRDVLVRMRTRLVSHVRGTLKAFGIHLPSCSATAFHRRVAAAIPDELKAAILPVLSCLHDLERQVRELDQTVERVMAERHPEWVLLQQVNGVGPVTSAAFVLTIGDPARFRRSRDVGAWAGLCPKKRESGDRDPQLSITKRGNGFVRRLLVTAANYILGPFGKDSDLRRFGQRLCERGGRNAKKRAVVAVARKLAVLLHRLWASRGKYEPCRGRVAAAPA